MSEFGKEPAEYSVAHIREALAVDHRTAELHVDAEVKGGSVVLSGRVSTEERRRAAEEVVLELYPEARVHNYLSVEVLDAEPEVEDLP
ncbi:MAG: BON domain-containing protein [Actinomycetota bacterium]